MVKLLHSFLTWPFLVKIMILDLSGFIDRLHLLQNLSSLHIFCCNSAADVDKSSKSSAYNKRLTLESYKTGASVSKTKSPKPSEPDTHNHTISADPDSEVRSITS